MTEEKKGIKTTKDLFIEETQDVILRGRRVVQNLRLRIETTKAIISNYDITLTRLKATGEKRYKQSIDKLSTRIIAEKLFLSNYEKTLNDFINNVSEYVLANQSELYKKVFINRVLFGKTLATISQELKIGEEAIKEVFAKIQGEIYG